MAAKKAKASSVKKSARPKVGAQKKPAASTSNSARAGKAKATAAAVYGGQVHEILAARRAPSSYAPTVRRQLRLSNLRKPSTPDALTPQEREQLTFVLRSQLATHLANPENDTEVAELVDEAGHVVYHLYAWNYGVGYLFCDGGPEDLVAMGTQHFIEVWHRDQRGVFWAVDDALARADPRLGQPLSFDWRSDDDWTKAPDGKNERRDWMVRFLRKRK
jgi:hypothetical protein